MYGVLLSARNYFVAGRADNSVTAGLCCFSFTGPVSCWWAMEGDEAFEKRMIRGAGARAAESSAS
jgi:hypothetical protein